MQVFKTGRDTIWSLCLHLCDRGTRGVVCHLFQWNILESPTWESDGQDTGLFCYMPVNFQKIVKFINWRLLVLADNRELY